MKNIIKLHGHSYEDDKWLKEISENTYKLVMDEIYIRVSEDPNNPNHYTYIDPEGGPMLGVGMSIDGKIIKDITHENGAFIITLENIS